MFEAKSCYGERTPEFLENDHTHKPTPYISVNHTHSANFEGVRIFPPGGCYELKI